MVLGSTIRLGDDIGTKRLDHVQWMGHRNNSARVDCVHLLDEFQYCGQLAGVLLDLILRQVQARKVGDVQNGFGFE